MTERLIHMAVFAILFIFVALWMWRTAENDPW